MSNNRIPTWGSGSISVIPSLPARLKFNFSTSDDEDSTDLDFDLSDFIDGSPDATTQPTFKNKNYYWEAPKCECGSWKTYGEKCSAIMHSNWCPMKGKR